ncbi:MAG: glycosyltransferase family 2 protein [Gemmatimonadota bacterium]
MSESRNQPLVSVMVSFLDERRFLSEAVESVLAQTYPRWELLLCDDGSADGSESIARQYARSHPERIRYLAHPSRENRGLSATRNLGLRNSRGELVTILDADDVWEPAKLERQVRALQDHPQADMVVGRSLWWYGWTGQPEDVARDCLSRITAAPNRVIRGVDALSRILRDPERLPCTGTIMARRDAVVNVGGFDDRFTGLYEDYVFLSKFLVQHDLVVVDECLDRYRQHPDSMCSVAAREEGFVRARRAEYLGWLREYIADRKVGPRLRWEVARESWIHRFPLLERLWDALRLLYGGSVTLAFALGRRILPASLRQQLWKRLVRQDRAETDSMTGRSSS